MENAINEIKSKLDIIEFIGNFINLKKSGRNFKAICPFHHEKTPSFVISPERQIWHCFGACQDGGDIVKFLMKWENITFIEALKELAEKAGVKIKRIDFEDKIWQKKERLINLNLLAVEYFQYILTKTNFGEKARDYLSNRKINTSIIKKFQIGYAPNSWNSLMQFLKKKKFTINEIFDTGLLVKSERGTYYDRFRGRIVFPIKDTRGSVIGFSGRILESGAKEAKYINTPETLLYHKRESLYGINLAKEAIRKNNNLYIVEGEFDVISPYQLGIENIVAIKGSAITREQLMLIKRYTNKITLTLDADEAGIEAIKRGITEAENFDFEIGIVNFDFAKDPDEAIQKDPAAFKKIMNKPIPIYDFLIDINRKKYSDDNPFNKKKIGEEVIPFISEINNPIVQSHYVKKLAQLLNISESSIETLIKKAKYIKKRPNITSFNKKTEQNISREIIIQKYILSIIFQNQKPYHIAKKIFAIISANDFSILSYEKICHCFLGNNQKDNEQFEINKFINNLSTELKAVFDELYLFASSDLGLENENIDKLSYEIKRFSLKRKISKILSSDKPMDEDVKNELLTLNQKLKEVEKTITKL